MGLSNRKCRCFPFAFPGRKGMDGYMSNQVETVVGLWDQLRQRVPLVHCLTNEVVKQFTANVLLAAGAAPAMVEQKEEAQEFVGVANALLVNLGTLSEVQMEVISATITSANAQGKPWVLDPVAVGVIGVRTRFAFQLLKEKPAIIRGNASEILALAGGEGKGKGMESGVQADDAVEAGQHLAKETGAIVLMTGETDYIFSDTVEVATKNGTPLLGRITGAGCALGALTAAFAGLGGSPLWAAVAASSVFSVAGELAVRESAGPGTLAVRLLDQLYNLSVDQLRETARIF